MNMNKIWMFNYKKDFPDRHRWHFSMSKEKNVSLLFSFVNYRSFALIPEGPNRLLHQFKEDLKNLDAIEIATTVEK